MIPQRQAGSEPLSKERLRLWLKLIKAHGSIETELRRRLREQFDTTLPRFDVMSALSRSSNGLKMSEISGLLKVSNGNITGIVDRLTDDGLVLRVAVPGDRRAQLVRLTSAGQSAFDELALEHEKWLDELLGSLDYENLGQFQDLLKNMTTHLEHSGADANA